ncbi:MAG: FecR domain-containing protein [Chitinophagaceae bacterium]
MPTEDKNLRDLLHAWVQDNLNDQQTEELFQYLSSHPQQSERLLHELTDTYKHKMINAPLLKEEISGRMLQGLLTKINTAPVIPIRQSTPGNWKRWAAAAAILLIAGSTTYLMIDHQPKTIAKQVFINTQHTEKDALPGFDGAVLTTAGGSQIILDNTTNGIVSKEGNTEAVKQTNQLVYNESSKALPEIETYNTLRTMKGRKFQLILADGTKVWLDAASSLTYPIAFTGMQRKVKATGQVYFEVAKDPAKPFIVEAAGTSVQVLGTHFNVNAYEDESTMKTTLLEGMIKITRDNNSSLLKPGQQAVINASEPGSIKVNNTVDIDAVMAWKNGLFQFINADLNTVLRQLSRWYDMDIVYEGKMPKREFEGKIGRDLNLSQVLKLLETLQVHFRIEGNKLIVQP